MRLIGKPAVSYTAGMANLDQRTLVRWCPLLMVVLLLCAGVGWFGVVLHNAHLRREVVEEVKRRGGGITYDFENTTGGHREPAPAWLRKLLGIDFFADVVDIIVAGKASPNTDAFLERLRSLKHLKRLYIREICDATDSGMAHIEAFSSLESLALASDRITDAGLGHLGNLRSLSYLDLDGCAAVTDAGLRYLKNIPKLKYLLLRRTSTTEECIQQLRRAMPKCLILSNLSSLPHGPICPRVDTRARP
jgi:hypothetical protein